MKKIISEVNELKKAIEYFNSFHDGFLKSVKIISGNKFIQNSDENPPWKKQIVEYTSSEEKLLNTGLSFVKKKGLFLEIHHYNYDWPNKTSNNKIFLYLINITNIDPNIIQMVGKCILDCDVEDRIPVLNIAFTFDTLDFLDPKPGSYKTKLLEFNKIYIQEKN